MGNIFTSTPTSRLFDAIKDRNSVAAIELINSNEVDLNYVQPDSYFVLVQMPYDEYTSLLYAIWIGLTDVALAIIANDQTDLNWIPKQLSGPIYLSAACYYNNRIIAMELIATGRVQPTSCALYWACRHNISDVALAIIKLDGSLCAYTKLDCTPLIWACINNMSEVALAILATGHGLPEYITSYGYTAQKAASYNSSMIEVLDLLTNNDKYIRYVESSHAHDLM